jgi:hypothetical protein
MIQELFDNEILIAGHYTDSSPVVPIQQIPEAEDNRSWQDAGLPADAPVIVYDIVIPGGYDTEFWNCREEVSLWAYDYDLEKLFEIKEFLYDLFRRFDLAADDVNNFDDGDSTFQFHYFDIMMGLPTDEIDQIVGRYGVNLVISYEYSREIQTNGRFA